MESNRAEAELAYHRDLRRIDDLIVQHTKSLREKRDHLKSLRTLVGQGLKVPEGEEAKINGQIVTLDKDLARLKSRRERLVQRRQQDLRDRTGNRFNTAPTTPASSHTAPRSHSRGPSSNRVASSSRESMPNAVGPSGIRPPPPQPRRKSANSSRSNMPSNGVSTPSSQQTPKRGRPHVTGSSPTGPDNIKRFRGAETGADSSHSSSNSRPISRASDNSSIIDLTGDDVQTRAEINHHQQRAYAIRGQRDGAGFALNGYQPGLDMFDPGPGGSHAAHAMGATSSPSHMNGNNPVGSVPNYHYSMHQPAMPRTWPGQSGPQSLPGTPAPSFNPFGANTPFGGVIPDDEDGGPRRPNQPYPPQRNAQQGNGAGLADVISRTNPLQLLDGDGNPYAHMPARAARIFDDTDKETEEARKGIRNLLNNLSSNIKVTQADQPRELKSNLYKHQLIALKWMQNQEKSTTKGGILADDMGLGKTISMLSLIVSRPPKNPSSLDPEDAEDDPVLDDDILAFGGPTKKIQKGPKIPYTKTNLIILPKGLMQQWQDEIASKLKTKLSVFVFHGSKKARAEELMKYDVVFTTYNTLLADYTRLQTFWKDAAGRNVNLETDWRLRKDVSFFHPKYSYFYRIILDESQAIKNHAGQTSLAVAALMGIYRWCMTGTPMMNSIKELYPLFRFLHMEPYNEKKIFDRNFSKLANPRANTAPPPGAMRLLQTVLKATMQRRTKDTLIDGQPIITLPNKTEEIVHITLDGSQRQFYEQLANDARITVNDYLRKGTFGKHYSHVLELLLRMRQACCHPHLIDGEEAKPEVDDAMIARAKTFAPEVVQRLTDKIMEVIDKAEGGFECPLCYETVPDPSLPLPCGHAHCHACLREVYQNAGRDNVRDGDEDACPRCPICRDPLGDASVTLKAFKKAHLPDYLSDDEGEETEENESDDDMDSDSDSDSDEDEDEDDVDNRGNLKGFIVDDEDEEALEDEEGIYDGDSPDKNQAPKTPKKKSKSKAKSKSKSNGKTPKRAKVKPSMLKHLRKEARKSQAAKRQYRRYLKKNWMPSAKVDACLELLRRIQKETDGEKTLIFSQWTMLLDFLEVAIGRDPELQHIDHVRIDGEMNVDERHAACQSLRNDDNTKLMLISLKAGNAGLNLVEASRVIIFDPFWNPYIEKQAVDRAYRIGQHREVKVYRILVKDTIEDRIAEIKDKKEKIISSALDEGVAANFGSFGRDEIARILGIA